MPDQQPTIDGGAAAFAAEGPMGNNYSRPEGQNVGNFLTDRPSSRVLSAPGGQSQITFGDEGVEPVKKVGVPLKNGDTGHVNILEMCQI